MPSLSGSLIDVTSAPSDATEVWIRAADGRVSGANVVLEETRRVPVTGGKFTVNVLPGRAHLVVIHAGMSQEHVPLLVQNGMTTIAEAVRLGSEDWEEYSPSQAEQIKAEIAAEVAKAAASAQAAKTAQQAAEKARTDTQNALSTKADKVHTHALADVTGLQAALNGKASTSHTHTTAQVEGLDTALAGKAAKAHMHTTAQVTGLDNALGAKADKVHKHAIDEVNGLPARLTGIDSALAGKAEKTDLVDLQGKIFQATISESKITQRTNTPGIETEVGYGGVQVNVPAILIIDYASSGTFFTSTGGVDNPRAMGVHVEFVLAEEWVVIKPAAKVIGIPL